MASVETGAAARVVGADDRLIIDDASGLFPNRAIAKVYVTFPNGVEHVGTASLVGSHHALTNGHLVYSAADGGWATSVELVFGKDGGEEWYDRVEVVDMSGWPQYIDTANPDYDIALLQLDRGIGNEIGWFGHQSSENADIYDGAAISSAGYPGDLSSGLSQYRIAGTALAESDATRLLYSDTMDTDAGQSGSPVWVESENGPLIIGVHRDDHDGSGFDGAVRITQQFANWIEDHKLNDPIPTDLADLTDWDSHFVGDLTAEVVQDGVDPGDAFSVITYVRNNGTTIAGTHTVTFYASIDATITIGDYLLGSVDIATGILPFDWTDAFLAAQLPDIPTGDYFVGWIIDSGGSVAEFDEADNTGIVIGQLLSIQGTGTAGDFVHNLTQDVLFATLVDAEAAASAGDQIAILSGYAEAGESVGVDVNNLTFTVIPGVGKPVFNMSGAATTLSLAGEGAADINGSGSADVINGNAGANILVGGVGNDRLTGRGGDDTLQGGLGNDTFLDLDASGTDSFDGGDNFDTMTFAGEATGAVIDLNNQANNAGAAAGNTFAAIEYFIGSNFADTMTGNAANNFFAGRSGSDTIGGGAGNDTFYDLDNIGTDAFDGGANFDTMSFINETTGATVDLTNQANNAGAAAGNSFANIEYFIGSSLADVMTGNTANNFLAGLGGSDTLSGGAGNDTFYDLDNIGADVFDGGANFDTMSFVNETSAVTIDLTNQANNAGAAAGNSFANIEHFVGTRFADTLIGNNANQFFTGGGGSDTISGGAGNDTFFDLDTAGTDAFDGGANFDTMSFQNETTGATVDLNSQANNAGAAVGNSFANIEHFIGTSFADTMTGGAGNQFFTGGGGSDTLAGGAGNDTFFDRDNGLADTFDGGANFDTMSFVNETAGVIVDLSDQGNNGGVAANDQFLNIEQFIGSGLADTLSGDTLNQWFVGGAGNDVLTGGGGFDTFMFAAGFGNDTITDFDALAAGGQDRISLAPHGISAAEFASDVEITELGSDALITIGTSTITLTGVALGDLDQTDFIFAA